jgi:hypothetical protein
VRTHAPRHTPETRGGRHARFPGERRCREDSKRERERRKHFFVNESLRSRFVATHLRLLFQFPFGEFPRPAPGTFFILFMPTPLRCILLGRRMASAASGKLTFTGGSPTFFLLTISRALQLWEYSGINDRLALPSLMLTINCSKPCTSRIIHCVGCHSSDIRYIQHGFLLSYLIHRFYQRSFLVHQLKLALFNIHFVI